MKEAELPAELGGAPKYCSVVSLGSKRQFLLSAMAVQSYIRHMHITQIQKFFA